VQLGRAVGCVCGGGFGRAGVEASEETAAAGARESPQGGGECRCRRQAAAGPSAPAPEASAGVDAGSRAGRGSQQRPRGREREGTWEREWERQWVACQEPPLASGAAALVLVAVGLDS